MEKQYVYNVSMMQFTGVENHYKTLVEIHFTKVQDHDPQILIKPVVYGGFFCSVAKRMIGILEKALRS